MSECNKATKQRVRELLEKWAAMADREMQTRIAEVDWAATFRRALAELGPGELDAQSAHLFALGKKTGRQEALEAIQTALGIHDLIAEELEGRG